MPERAPQAAISVDVEDWFQVENLKPVVARETWDGRERRVERNTDRILELLAQRGLHGTFFILGWVAERHPDLVRRIAGGGHEIASHGYGHDLVYTLTEQEFRADVGPLSSFAPGSTRCASRACRSVGADCPGEGEGTSACCPTPSGGAESRGLCDPAHPTSSTCIRGRSTPISLA
jgi:hypothetical protein